jgi:APA family basic amino acid/polyamine antiporter
LSEGSESELRPTLGLFDATAVGVGAIIGGGIFVVTGIVAGLAGPALVVSIVIAGVISLFTALSFVELTAWLPTEGSIYEFAGRLLSPFAGFLGGWMWVVSNTFAGAAVSMGFAYYLTALVPALDPRWIAASLCAAFTVINLVGARQSALFNNALVSAKVLILFVFIVVGALRLNPANFVPFVPSGTGILYGAYFIFFAFSGFARIAVMSEEVKDARRIVPRSILLALLLSGIVYVLVGIVAVGLIGADGLATSNSPLAKAIQTVGIPFLVYLVSAGGMFATASVLLTSILGVSRMAFSMSRRGDLPSALKALHPRFDTPYVSILTIGAVTVLLATFVDLTGIVGVSTFVSLFYYALANASALRIDVANRVYPKFVPAVGLVTSIALGAFVQPSAFAIGVICLAVGAAYYLVIHRKGYHG